MAALAGAGPTFAAIVLCVLFVMPPRAEAIELPIKTLPLVKSLPDASPQLLEMRTRLVQCDGQQIDPKDEEKCRANGVWQEELAILQVGTGHEVAWDLPSIRALPALAAHFECGAGGQMKSWASAAGRLLYGRCGSAYLVGRDGSLEALRLKMPGRLSPFEGMSQYSVSSDAQRISYTLYVRDGNDKEVDRLGRLYRDLVVQETRGSTPVALAQGYTDYRAVLSPDGLRVAYSSGAFVKVLTLSGDVVANIAAPETEQASQLTIQEIRWSPDGTTLAARINRKLYMAASRNGDFTLVTRDNKIAFVENLAWSPDGREIAFRSAHEGEETCSYGPQFSGGSIVFRRCAPGYRLYSVDVSSGNARRVNASTEYRPGQLFWLQ